MIGKWKRKRVRTAQEHGRTAHHSPKNRRARNAKLIISRIRGNNFNSGSSESEIQRISSISLSGLGSPTALIKKLRAQSCHFAARRGMAVSASTDMTFIPVSSRTSLLIATSNGLQPVSAAST